MFDASTLPVLQEVLSFTEARQNVLAGNIANYGTPGYRVRDLSPQNFQEKLRDALEARDRSRESLASGISQGEVDAKMKHVRDSLKDILYHDETNVSLEHQVSEMNKNQLLHNTAIALLTGQFRLLQTAVSERI